MLEDSVHAVFHFQWELESAVLSFNMYCGVIFLGFELPTPLGILKI